MFIHFVLLISDSSSANPMNKSQQRPTSGYQAHNIRVNNDIPAITRQGGAMGPRARNGKRIIGNSHSSSAQYTTKGFDYSDYLEFHTCNFVLEDSIPTTGGRVFDFGLENHIYVSYEDPNGACGLHKINTLTSTREKLSIHNGKIRDVRQCPDQVCFKI